MAATYPDPQAPRSLFRQRRLLARSEVERRGHYITQLHQQLGEGHPLVQLVEECLANEAEERPSAEEVLQRLEQMDIDDPYQNLTKLDMIRMVGQKEEEIQRTVRESQQKDREIQRGGEEIQQRDEEIGQKEQIIRQKEEEIRRKDEENHQMGEEIQRKDEDMRHKEAELRQKTEEIAQKDGEKQRLQAQVQQLQVSQSLQHVWEQAY